MSLSPKYRAALALAALMALGACGRRGDLEPPSAAVATPSAQDRHHMEVHRVNQNITPPNKDFVLDPLLK